MSQHPCGLQVSCLNDVNLYKYYFYNPEVTRQMTVPKYILHFIQIGAFLLGTSAAFAETDDAALKATQPNTKLPAWLHIPTLTTLADGTVMSVGILDDRQPPIAHIWQPQDNSWTETGMLTHEGWNDAQAILLPSNNVMHIDWVNKFNCDLWAEKTHQWEDCSNQELIGQIGTKPGIGIIKGGMVVMVTSTMQAFVFDESSKQWSSRLSEWHEKGLSYGAPIRGVKPLMRIFDPQQGVWIDISSVAGKFWQNVRERIEHRIDSSNGSSQTFGYSAPGPAMIWDDKNERWTYLFLLADGKMGVDPLQLPDGCIFTWHTFKLFNPRTGKITKLKDPGIGINFGHGSVTLLHDNTAVFTGVVHGDNAKLYKTRLTCNGFSSVDDNPSVSNVGAESTTNKTSLTVHKPKAELTLKQVLSQLKSFIAEYRWNLLAVFGPITLYLFTRHKFKLKSDKASQNKISNLLLRIAIYGTLIVFAYFAVKSYMYRRTEQSKQDCAESAANCIDKNTGLLQSELIAGNLNDSKIPCRYVGVWSSRAVDHQGEMHRVDLNDDGTYSMMKPGADANSAPLYKGYWAIQGQNMVWRHGNGGNGEADINPIKMLSATEFTLTEGNGTHTAFDLIEAIPSKRCSH